METQGEKWNVRAETREGDVQWAWGLAKETAKQVAKDQRSRGVFRSVRIVPDKKGKELRCQN